MTSLREPVRREWPSRMASKSDLVRSALCRCRVDRLSHIIEAASVVELVRVDVERDAGARMAKLS